MRMYYLKNEETGEVFPRVWCSDGFPAALGDCVVLNGMVLHVVGRETCSGGWECYPLYEREDE